MPKVSVIINTYNSAQYVPLAVESVLAQTLRDFELIVVDDGSTDDTRQILARYGDRLTYIYQENKKYSAARNTGIRAAAGEYVAFLDSDDIWYTRKLERQVPILDQHANVVLAHSQFAYVDAEGKPTVFMGKPVGGAGELGGLEPGCPSQDRVVIADLRRDLFFGTNIRTSTVLVRRRALAQAGLFDEAHIHGEDWELWVRLAATGQFAYIAEPLIQYRVYGWSKPLAVEASEPWLSDQMRTMERNVQLWTGDPAECTRLRDRGLARVYTRAALSSLQVGKLEQGKTLLGRAFACDPTLQSRRRQIDLALDRAKEIQLESQSLELGENYIRTFFANLPASAAHHRGARQDALAWLSVDVAFERHRAGDVAGARRYLRRAVAYSPRCLINRGVLSVALSAWLGEDKVSGLRRIARRMVGSVERRVSG